MHVPTLLTLTSLLLPIYAQSPAPANKTGWTGTLSSLDGGLGGTVTVIDASTLRITNYALEDGQAPALYWWGTASTKLSEGFRISNKQVKEAATSNVYNITLDAGKGLADFGTVGLWCEKFSANFGQATLAPPSGGNTPTPTGGSTPAGSTPGGGMNGNGNGNMNKNGAAGVGVSWTVVGLAGVLAAGMLSG